MGAFKRAACVSNTQVETLIGLAWCVGTFGCGWVLAWMYKRLHPQLAFYKLWAFWSAILGGVMALVFAFGAVRM